jgi:hypothetical protein
MNDAKAECTLRERKQECVDYTDYHIHCAIYRLLAHAHIVARVGDNDRILSRYDARSQWQVSHKLRHGALTDRVGAASANESPANTKTDKYLHACKSMVDTELAVKVLDGNVGGFLNDSC